MRERGVAKDLPIIILTTSENREHRDECYSLGAEYFITKPSSFDELVKVVKNLGSFIKTRAV
jgi:two-component system response regulator